MAEVSLTIDGLEFTANEDITLLEAALENGIYIPHLCHHRDLAPAGMCRLCMVEVDGRRMVISCKTQVKDGMVVRTESEQINRVRKISVELLIANHQGDCLSCNKSTSCELQRISSYLGINKEDMDRMRRFDKIRPIDTSNPFFDYDPNKCVLCGICVRTCAELQGVSAIDLAFRGFETSISTFGAKPWVESNCESCGECIIRCPVGALMPKNRLSPSYEVRSVCSYCGCGCGMYLGVRAGRIVSVRGEIDNPSNRGSLCVKGRFGYEFVNHTQRLSEPLIKKNGEFVEASWEEALELVTEKFSQYKGEQFASIASAKCTNEESYVLQKFTRVVMGTNNIDHCARLCHAPTVAGLATSLGSGAMTNPISDIGGASCILAVGTNTTVAHPIIGLQVKKAVQNGAKLIVINPKEIDLCRFADIFLQARPGTNVALLMGMMRIIVDEGLLDTSFIKSRCENFDTFKESLKNFDIQTVEKITGVPKEDLIEAARCYATNKPASILYAMGITQHIHGTDNVLAVSNLALLTGNIGIPSAGVNPLRGQNNVQGACDMGALPNVYPGYQRVDDPEVQKRFESVWGYDLSSSPGLTHTEIFDAVHDGKVKAIYLVGENPILSEANASHTEAAIAKLGFLVVQDIFLTETAKLADVVLPAVTFAEKDGTFTNTERRVQRVRKAIEPVGNAKNDLWITCRIAQRMGGKGFDFSSPFEVMKEIASVTPQYRGISYDRLEKSGLQWPCVSEDHPGTPILHTERFATKSGKAKFMPLEHKPSAELPDDEYPLLLTTDRSLYHFHTSTMSGRVEGLNVLDGHEFVRINPKDAACLEITDDQMVRVFSRRGEVEVKANVTDVCPPGVVSMTFHFPESRTNVLTSSALDPVAKIPETKVCAVRIERMKQ